MNKRINYSMSLYLLCWAALLRAPDAIEFDGNSGKSLRTSSLDRELQLEQQKRQKITESKKTVIKPKTKSIADFQPHEPIESYDNRSRFLQAIKLRDIDSAQQMWQSTRTSDLSTNDFVQHVFKAYNSRPDMAKIYPGKSFDEAHTLLLKDLEDINPHVAKTFRDSFKTKSKTQAAPVARDDQAYFDWLDKYPTEITMPFEINAQTPFETAVATGSAEMARGIMKIAEQHNISTMDLIDPLINEYKIIMKDKGEQAALAFVDKVMALDIKRVSRLFLNTVQQIDFSKTKTN